MDPHSSMAHGMSQPWNHNGMKTFSAAAPQSQRNVGAADRATQWAAARVMLSRYAESSMTPDDPPQDFSCWTSELRRMDFERLKADVERTQYWRDLGIHPESRLAAELRRQLRMASEYGGVHQLLLALEAGDWQIR